MLLPQHALSPLLFMDLERSGPIPMWYQVSTRIESAIHSQDLPPGARLENELALASKLGISRPTIRRAIQELVDKGLLVRRRGIGTQVVQGQVTRNVELTSLYEDLERVGQHPSTTVLNLETIPADAKTAVSLGIGVEAPTFHIRRLRLADRVPLAIMENFLPAEFGDLTTQDLEEHGLYQMLRSRGVNIRVARQRIGARSASSSETELLGLEKKNPVLTMERVAFDNSGRAIEVGTHCYRPDLYSFEVTLVER